MLALGLLAPPPGSQPSRGGRPGWWGPACAQRRPRVPSQAVVRVCCIRSFGHFVARLQGSVLQFSPAAGIFVSTAQSEQDGLLPQAQAQLRMVSRARGERG